MRTFLRPGVIAGVAAAVLLASLGGLLYRQPDDTYQVQASFPRAIGLYPGSTVRVLGVEVGRIDGIRPDGDRVTVTMNIADGVRIPRDARAIIVPISLISDRYVQLEPVWREGPVLEDGDEIPLDRGIAPAELDDLLATLKDFLDAIEPGEPGNPGALGEFVQNANQALDGQGQALGSTIDGLATVLDVLGRNSQKLDSLIVSFDRIMGSLARRDAAIQATNRGLASVLGALAEERQALESGIGSLADLVDRVGSLVQTHDADLRRDLETLAATTEILARNEEFLRRNLSWLPVLEQGALNIYDPEHKRFIVRDNAQEQLPVPVP